MDAAARPHLRRQGLSRLDDDFIVEAQIGRPPRGTWVVAARCPTGRPAVIQTAPVLDSGEPFPTLYWLTCPWLLRLVSAEESAGGASRWAENVACDPELQARVLMADSEYRARRVLAGGGGDPCRGGIAGQRGPGATKCLHAHAAAFLAGIADPIGEGVLASIERWCPDDLCAPLGQVP